MKILREILTYEDNIKELIGDVYCPTCRKEKCVYISNSKTTNFYDCKKCKDCCHSLNIPFKDQKPTIMLFGCDGTHIFARKTSRDYEKEKPSAFLKKVLRQSQPSTYEPKPNNSKICPNMEKACPLMIFGQQIHFFNAFIQLHSTVNHSNLINLQSTYSK